MSDPDKWSRRGTTQAVKARRWQAAERVVAACVRWFISMICSFPAPTVPNSVTVPGLVLDVRMLPIPPTLHSKPEQFRLGGVPAGGGGGVGRLPWQGGTPTSPTVLGADHVSP